MAKVTYSKKTRTFTAIWKDYACEAEGKRYPYGRKSRRWTGQKAPTAAEKRQMICEMLLHAQKAELASLERAEHIRIYGAQAAVSAEAYLEGLGEDELCISTTQEARKAARQVINTFVRWLKVEHAGLALHRVNSCIAAQYYRYLQATNLSYGTIEHYIARLRFVFHAAQLRYEESVYKPGNPFAALRLHKVIPKVMGHRRKPYTEAQLAGFLAAAAEQGGPNMWRRLQRFGAYYFLIVTGWRVNDVLRMRWEQVDMQRGIIWMKHSKTQNIGIRTELKITGLMQTLLPALEKLQELAAEEHRGYMFPLWSGKAGSAYADLAQHFAKCRAEWQLAEYEQQGVNKTHTYTIHSFRGTLITLLTRAGFQESLINYLVGHAPRGTEARHYLTLGAEDTRAMVEYMEKICKAQQWEEKLRNPDFSG